MKRKPSKRRLKFEDYMSVRGLPKDVDWYAGSTYPSSEFFIHMIYMLKIGTTHPAVIRRFLRDVADQLDYMHQGGAMMMGMIDRQEEKICKVLTGPSVWDNVMRGEKLQNVSDVKRTAK